MNSISDLKALVAAKDAEVGVVDSDYQRMNNSAWKASSEGQKWLHDWSVFRDNYNAARAQAEQAITAAGTSFLPDAVNPADREYARVVAAVQGHPSVMKDFNAQQEGIVLDGGFHDLFLRLAPARSAVDAMTRAAADKEQAANQVKAAAAKTTLQNWQPPTPQYQPSQISSRPPLAMRSPVPLVALAIGGSLAVLGIGVAMVIKKAPTQVPNSVL